ncbi:hypothetical protein F4604DRAFT_1706439 [Suillus subluteus]|nr:hypothetical protein F4604DRAFT_1706439 [Suillus subluteus]
MSGNVGIFDANPYESHASLTCTGGECFVGLTVTTRRLSEGPDENLIARLRVLERKMGLVLTLFKASVWGVINEQPVQEIEGGYAYATADTTLRR